MVTELDIHKSVATLPKSLALSIAPPSRHEFIKGLGLSLSATHADALATPYEM